MAVVLLAFSFIMVVVIDVEVLRPRVALDLPIWSAIRLAVFGVVTGGNRKLARFAIEWWVVDVRLHKIWNGACTLGMIAAHYSLALLATHYSLHITRCTLLAAHE